MKRILIKAETFLLITFLFACSSDQFQATAPSPRPSALAKESQPASVYTQAPSPEPQTDTFEQASDKAIGAANIAQSAQSQDDWKLVVAHWKEAIALMKAVPTSSPKGALAQTKVVEYQRNLAVAKQKAENRQPQVSFSPATTPPLLVVPPAATKLSAPPPPLERPPGLGLLPPLIPAPIKGTPSPSPTSEVPF